MKHHLAAAIFCLILASFQHLYAQTTAPTLSVTNAANQTITLSSSDIKALPHTELQIMAHDGKMHSYTGVALPVLLQKAAVPMGDSAKKKTAGSYVVITATDHYTAVYALAEIDTLMSDKKIILADEEDGKPLPQNALPYQVIATGEKIHARMIRQVTSIAVKEAH